jgi:uncharacterized protein
MLKFPPIITHAYLVLTNGCNLRCNYCYCKERDKNDEMPFEYVEKIKKAFTCYNKPRIIFFGGEPLIKIDLMKRIVESYKDDFVFQVVTNGTINLHRFVEEIYKPYRKIFDVQVSWDGNKTTRKMFSGKESNDIVYENMLKELQNGASFEGRCVLSDDSVNSFYETYLTFKELNHQYRFGGDFTIAHVPSFSESYKTVLGQQLEMIYEDMRKELFSKDFYGVPFIMKTIVNVLQKRPVISCDIGTCIVVKPNGDLYPCTILSQQAERFKLGNINDDIDTEIITKLRSPASCQKDCPVKSLCDGGCRYERILNFGEYWHESICGHTCGIYNEIFNRTNAFLKSLTPEESDKLFTYLDEYNLWSIDYVDGITDNSKRLYKE